MPRKWFHLVDGSGKELASPAAVVVEIEDVVAFRDAVKEKYKDCLLAGIAPSDLAVYQNQVEFKAKHKLQGNSSTELLGQTIVESLVVVAETYERANKKPRLDVVPSHFFARNHEIHLWNIINTRLKSETFVSLDVDSMRPCNIDELMFNLDHSKKKSLMKTSAIAEVMEQYGGFPSHFFARNHEIHLWNIINTRLKSESFVSVVLTGSPGVGKSTFMVLVAFNQARVENRSVLMIRKTKVGNFYLFLRGDTFYGGQLHDMKESILYLREATKSIDPSRLIFLDGFNQDEIKQNSQIQVFNFLATSNQYDAKQYEEKLKYLYPAWSKLELEEYYRSVHPDVPLATSHEKVEDKYFYSGGSMRSFLWEKQDIMTYIVDALGICGDLIRLTSSSGSRSSYQVDRLRRAYIKPLPKDESPDFHYGFSSNYVYLVDSKYALLQLFDRLDLEEYESLFGLTKTVGGGFEGVGYELLFHKRVTHAVTTSYTNNAIANKMMNYFVPSSYSPQFKLHPRTINGNQIGDSAVEVVISGGKVDYSGTSKKECFQKLKEMADTDIVYWHPKMINFPIIDSVAKCVCNGTNWLVMIQVTIDRVKELDLTAPDWNSIIHPFSPEKYPNVMFLIVTPEHIAKTFTLTISNRDLSQRKVKEMIAYF